MNGWRKHHAPLCVLLGIVGLCPSAFSEPSQGWGKVSMYGEIVDTACAIETESRDQTIDMGVIPVSVLKQFGKAPPKPFHIQLVDCHVDRYSGTQNEWKSFDVTFDGPASGEFFTVSGEAKGVQLAMRDDQGIPIIAGKPLPKKELIPGDMTLNYELQLVTNNQRLQAGSYQTLLRFKIDYY